MDKPPNTDGNGTGGPDRPPYHDTTKEPAPNKYSSRPQSQDARTRVVWTGGCRSSASVRLRLFVGRIATAALRSPGVRSLARVGLRLAQLQAIGAEDSDNSECAQSDLFKEFGF